MRGFTKFTKSLILSVTIFLLVVGIIVAYNSRLTSWLLVNNGFNFVQGENLSSTPISTPTLVSSTVTATPTNQPSPLITTTPTQILATATPTNTPVPKASPNKATTASRDGGLVTVSLSPKIAELMYVDAEGNRVGHDPVSGEVVNDFVDEDVSFPELEELVEGGFGNYVDNQLMLFSPLPGKADLIVTGIGDGEYQIIAGSLGSEYFHRITGTITLGEVQTRTIEIYPVE